MAASVAAPLRERGEETSTVSGRPPKVVPWPELNASDLLSAALLAVAAFLLNAGGIWPIEFFRHTEADRMIIGIEMLRRGDFLVPTLLDSVILTKPPLFYWLVAASISLFGTSAEWVGRFPSVVAGAAFAFFQYLLLILAGLPRIRAVLCVVVLFASLLFMQLGSAAEIDMTFGAFTGLGLSTFYLALQRRSLGWTVAAYLLFALAFLTKGPPVVFFAAGAFAAYFIAERLSGEKPPAGRLVALQVLGICCFLVLTLSWLLTLSGEVGWEALRKQYDIEVHERVFMESNRQRSALFYVGSLLIGLSPWAAVAAVGLLWIGLKKPRLAPIPQRETRAVIYHAGLFLFGFLLLSIAEGKSSRYLFPLYGSAAVAVAYVLLLLRDTPVQQKLFAFCRWAALPLDICLLGSALYFELAGVSRAAWLIASAAVAVPVLGVWRSAKLRRPAAAVVCLCAVLFALRVAQITVFAPHRNATRSVRATAAALQRAVAPGEPIYVVEAFERWVFYYIIRDGRPVYRLDPAKAERLGAGNEKIYLLLNAAAESWRLNELMLYTNEVELVREFSSPKEEFLLVRTPAHAAAKLKVRELFPTTPTVPSPYRNELPHELASTL